MLMLAETAAISLLFFPVLTCSIQCWTCVGTDCDTYQESSKNWEVVTCPSGSVCQKTNYSFYSNQKNQTLNSHTVRSCSYETGCTIERSKKCKKTAIEFAGRGCVDRYCCSKDKCNSSDTKRHHFIIFELILSMFLLSEQNVFCCF